MSASRSQTASRRGSLLFAGAVAAGPAVAFWHLHGLWNPGGDYAYGWVVPVLAAYLFKCRWEERPPAGMAGRGAGLVAMLAAVAVLPAYWLFEAAPERSVTGWGLTLACVVGALALLARAGGWEWGRWFCFPVAFTLTAVPWPHGLELLISNSLMRRTAAATVETLCLTGVPAVQAGNLVRIETGVIDIDEACSGIRSLQAMVMIALFLGELFRLRPGRRVLLIVLGLIVTLAANILRTVTLSSIGFHQGMAAVDRWHDAAGFVVLILSLAVTLLIAWLLRRKENPKQVGAASAPAIPAALVTICGALLIWLAAAQVTVEAWYRLHEPAWAGWSWSIQLPRSAPGFHPVDIPPRSLRLLMCDESQAATWQEPGGAEWSLYWIRWNPGNLAAEAAKVHRPDVCLTAEGAILESDLVTRAFPIGGEQVPFRHYTFLIGGKRRLHVFFVVSEEGPGVPAGSWNPRFEGVEMLQRAIAGRRHAGGQSLEIALSGYASDAAAEAAFAAGVPRLMQLMQFSGQRIAPRPVRP